MLYLQKRICFIASLFSYQYLQTENEKVIEEMRTAKETLMDEKDRLADVAQRTTVELDSVRVEMDKLRRQASDKDGKLEAAAELRSTVQRLEAELLGTSIFDNVVDGGTLLLHLSLHLLVPSTPCKPNLKRSYHCLTCRWLSYFVHSLIEFREKYWSSIRLQTSWNFYRQKSRLTLYYLINFRKRGQDFLVVGSVASSSASGPNTNGVREETGRSRQTIRPASGRTDGTASRRAEERFEFVFIFVILHSRSAGIFPRCDRRNRSKADRGVKWSHLFIRT